MLKRVVVFIIGFASTVSLAFNVNASDSASVTGVDFVVNGSRSCILITVR